jgi:HAD superfamily hydrolase (TIGR01490 family)
MNLAVFDLDHTLLAHDSDYLWGQHMVENGFVDADYYATENQRFYDAYAAGTLDINEFSRFALAPLVRHDLAVLIASRERFIREKIAPIIARHTPALLQRHRDQGDTLLITTATNRFIVEPIAELLGVPNLLATEPEVEDGRYTGRLAHTNFRESKVSNLRAWLSTQTTPYQKLFGYSDSNNDLPLLEFVDHPHAVDPDDKLRATAVSRGWPVISLRD